MDLDGFREVAGGRAGDQGGQDVGARLAGEVDFDVGVCFLEAGNKAVEELQGFTHGIVIEGPELDGNSLLR